jgi:hypothetical protein
LKIDGIRNSLGEYSMSKLSNVCSKGATKTAAQAGAAVSVTIPGDGLTPVKLLSVTLTLSAAATTGGDTLSIVKDSGLDAVYDATILSITRTEFGAITSYVWAPVGGYAVPAGCSLIASWTHTDANIASIELNYEVY